MFEWLFKSRTEDISNVLEIIAKDLTKVQLAVMAQEKAAAVLRKDVTKAADAFAAADPVYRLYAFR